MSSRHFTLIEILIAIAILALGMLGILGLIPMAMRMTADTMHRSVGGSVGRSVFTYELQHGDVSEDIQDELADLAAGESTNVPAEGSEDYTVEDEETDYSWTANFTKTGPDTYAAQVAVWHDHTLKISDAKVKDDEDAEVELRGWGSFLEDGDTEVDVRGGDYIRIQEKDGPWLRWLKIKDVEEEPGGISISIHGDWDAEEADKIEVAGYHTLISLYDGILQSE